MEMKFSGLKNGRLSIFLIGLIFLQIIANANAVPVTKDETEPIAKPVDSVDLKENKEVEKTIVAPITEHGDKVVAEVKTEHSIDSDTTEKITTTTTEPEVTTVEPEITTVEATTEEPVVEKKKVLKTTVEVEPEVLLETPKKTTTVAEVEEEEETTTIRPKVVKTTTEETAEVEPEPVVKKVVKPATKEIKKTSKKAKFIEICTGSLQSPWFCNLDDFAEDKRCSHVYSLKWTYEREKELLEIKFRYQPFGEEKVALGLINVQAANGWFAVKKEHSLFDDFLYWNEEDDTTEITRLTKNYFRIRQTVRPDQIKCSGIGFFIYTTNEHNDTLNYHFHASSRSEVCPSTCSICLSKPDMGIPCTVEPESRFYFNKKYGRCVEFIYSGCGGNQNNFLTLEACHSRCAPHLLEEQKSVKKSTKKAKEEEEEEEDDEEEKEKKKSKKKVSKKSRRSVVDEPIDDEFSTPAKIPKNDRTRELKKPIADQKVVLPKARTFTPTQPRQIKKLVDDEKIQISKPVEKKVVEHDHSIESHTVKTTPKTTTESIDEEEETTTVKPIITTTTKRTTTEVPEIDEEIETTTKKFVATTEPTTTTHHTIVSTTTERDTTTVKPVIKFSTTTPENEEDEVDFVTTSTVRPKVSVDEKEEEEEIVRSTTTTTTRPTTTTTTTTEEIEETTTTTTEKPTTTSTTTTTTTEKPTTTSTTTTTTTTTTEKPTTTTTTTTEPTTTTTTTTTTEKPTTTTSTTTTTEPTTTTTEKPTTTTTTTERVPVTTTTEKVIEEEVETTTKRPITTTTTTTTTEEDEIVITTTVPVTTEVPTTTTILNKIKESIAKDIETTSVEMIRSTTPVSRVDEDIEETTVPTTTSTTTTTAGTTTTDKMLEDLSNQIKFEVTNYTSIDNNEDSTETKSYSLRLHIKGYKWNERFHDVNSTEAKEFMRSKILPLLYKYLNVTPDELNEVKLLRLFKGSVQSDITVKSNTTSNLNNVISSAMKFKADRENTPEVEKSAIQIINDELNAMQKNANCTNFYTNYSMIVIAEKTLFTPSFNESLLGLLKNAILKFYAPSIDDVEIEIADYKCLNKSVAVRVKDKFSKPMSVRSYTLSFEAKIKLTPSYIKSAIETASIGRIDCTSEKRHEFLPYCSLMSKNSSYLIRMSDYWIDLENPEIPATAKLIEEMQLFTYKPAWIIGLAVIGCILGIFFVGCLIAICYTRRPYKRAGKIYELDTNNRNQIPQIPGMYPSTKTSTLPKAKELHY